MGYSCALRDRGRKCNNNNFKSCWQNGKIYRYRFNSITNLYGCARASPLSIRCTRCQGGSVVLLFWLFFFFLSLLISVPSPMKPSIECTKWKYYTFIVYMRRRSPRARAYNRCIYSLKEEMHETVKRKGLLMSWCVEMHGEAGGTVEN